MTTVLNDQGIKKIRKWQVDFKKNQLKILEIKLSSLK